MLIRRPFSALLASLLLTLSAPCSAFAAPVNAPQEVKRPFALERLKRLEADIELYRSLRSEWPGYDLLSYTLVFADKNGEAYLLNTAPSGSALSQDVQPIAGLAHIKRISPEAVKRWNLATEHFFETKPLGEETLFVVAPMPHEDPVHEFMTLLHEGFHEYQEAKLAIQYARGDENYASADDYAYTQVEAHLLARLSGEPNPARLKRGLQLYRAVRARHARLISKDLTTYRQGMDVTEGTAQYLTDQFHQKARPAGDENRIAMTAAKLKQRLELPQEADRSRYYHMGSALSHLMDKTVPTWKSRFASPGGSFDNLLAGYLGAASEQPDVWLTLGPSFSLDARLSTARKAYARLAEEAKQELEAAIKRHHEGGPTQLRVVFPDRKGVALSGSWVIFHDLPNGDSLAEAKLYSIKRKGESAEILTSQDGSVLRRIHESNMILEFRRTLQPEDFLVAGQPFVPAAAPLRGPVQLEKPGLKLAFRQAELRQEADGTLVIQVLEP